MLMHYESIRDRMPHCNDQQYGGVSRPIKSSKWTIAIRLRTSTRRAKFADRAGRILPSPAEGDRLKAFGELEQPGASGRMQRL